MTIPLLNKIPIGIFSIFLFLFLWSCSGKNKNVIPAEVKGLENLTVLPAKIQPSHDITIKEEKVFGNFETKGVVGGIRDIAIDDSGRIFISDTQQETIHVFSPDGQFLQNLGRRGHGPGEFGHIFDMKIQGDKLFAFDPTLYRINFYSVESLTFDHTEGLFFQDWADNPNIRKASPIKFYDWGGHNMLIGFDQFSGIGKDSIYYYLVKNSNHRTNIISQPVLRQKKDTYPWIYVDYHNGMRGPMDLPFGRKSLIAVSGGRHIFSAWTDRFLIKEYDPKGIYLRA